MPTTASARKRRGKRWLEFSSPLPACGESEQKRRRHLSWPGLSRPSTSSILRKQDVDARHEAGHDDKPEGSMSLPSEVDIAIIGAGAAGLGAARALENSALSRIVLEARDRI